MPSIIATIFGLSTSEELAASEDAAKIVPLTEWISQAIDAAKDSPLFDALVGTGDAAKEWSGTLRVAGKVLEKITAETSPLAVGWLAATISYREAAATAFRTLGRPESRIPFSSEIVHDRLKNLRLDDPSIMEGFSLVGSAGHPFIQLANQALFATSEAAGYSPTESRILLRMIRGSFNQTLQSLLSGEHKEKFERFAQWLVLDSDDARFQEMMLAHAELQRTALEDEPALGVEPFAVGDVYVEPECGLLHWRQIADRQVEAGQIVQVDPFSEESAPREDLMTAVLSKLGDGQFRDCVVIQGAPGAGKSTFTRKLSVKLRDEGFLPVRIPLQYLRVDLNLFDALELFIKNFSGDAQGPRNHGLLAQKVFAEKLPYGDASVSQYVFIFDGWDEISISAAEGYLERVEKLLTAIRTTFLNQNKLLIRVIVTGRPSDAVGKSNFLLEDTPILTIRPTNPEKLQRYIELLAASLAKPSFVSDAITPWSLGDLARYSPIIKSYQKKFPLVGSLEVLGQPLLAHLAIKVMAQFKGELLTLINSHTTLYRNLVDLTCKKAGKTPTDMTETMKTGKFAGKELRRLLHGTALAITAHGSEAIPMEELELRLETLGIDAAFLQTPSKHPLSGLMISFYFKGHTHSGCEFLHKSFREYLAAEAILECLKDFGRLSTITLPEKDAHRYWQGFAIDDPRTDLACSLGEILGPQLLSVEIIGHVRSLINWEVKRSAMAKQQKMKKVDELATEEVTSSAWMGIRDGLADLWDWWGEGVHLRIQPVEKQKIWHLETPLLVTQFLKRAMRRANYDRRVPPHPPRVTTLDSHLGFGLFTLNQAVHSAISESHNWTKLFSKFRPNEVWAQIAQGPRRYQCTVRCDDKVFVQFAPSGAGALYFRNYANRINAAGTGIFSVRSFPSFSRLDGVNLSQCDLRSLQLIGTELRTANLSGVLATQTEFSSVRGTNANFVGANLFGALLWSCDFTGATFLECNMFMVDGRQANFAKAYDLSQDQVEDFAAGSNGTTLPHELVRPRAWSKFAQKTASDEIAAEETSE